MALYDNNGNNVTEPTNTKRAPKTDYTHLTHNGKKYETLDAMITQIARERSHVAFKSTALILVELKVKKTDEQIAEAMVKANEKMIHDFVKNRDDSRGLFGLA